MANEAEDLTAWPDCPEMIWSELVRRVHARTPARLLAGRAGAAYRTQTQLELRKAHAAARDAVRGNGNLFQKLARAYKQINAPVGQLGLATLGISNTALSSGSSLDDSTYTQLESQLAAINSQRDAIAGEWSGAFDCERKYVTSRLDPDAAEN